VKDRIIVRGARQHNLKGFDVEIPRRSYTVVTGPSGSGKSSLAFDTIYAEGQRRYVESLSAYARQFLERMEKPDVDSVEGLSPAGGDRAAQPDQDVALDRRHGHRGLRLPPAPVGARGAHVLPRRADRELRPDTVEGVRRRRGPPARGTRFSVAFPLRLSAKVTHAVVDENLRAQGFVRVAVDGATLHLDDVAARGVDLTTVRDLLVVVDRLASGPEAAARLSDALGTAFREGDGDAALLFAEAVPSPVAGGGAAPGTMVTRLNFTERFECPNDGTRLPAPSPQLFSFNSPRGACETCNGFGAVLEYDEGLIVCDPSRTLASGAVDIWEKPRYEAERRKVVEFARRERIPVDVPWRDLPRAQQEQVLHASGRGYVGAFPFLRSKEEKRYKQYIRVFLRQYQTAQECPACRGARSSPRRCACAWAARRSARRGDAGRRARRLARRARAAPFERQVAAHILDEARAACASSSTWGSATSRSTGARARSPGGEAQRIGPRQLARRAARRHALRARRAERGAALARHAAAARAAPPAARRGEHGARRRARPRGHRGRRLHDRDRPGERRAGRPPRVRRARSAARPRARSPGSTSAARARCRSPPSGGGSGRGGSRSPARASTTSRAPTCASRSAR
jgi:excinuclease ABC subunit A